MRSRGPMLVRTDRHGFVPFVAHESEQLGRLPAVGLPNDNGPALLAIVGETEVWSFERLAQPPPPRLVTIGGRLVPQSGLTLADLGERDVTVGGRWVQTDTTGRFSATIETRGSVRVSLVDLREWNEDKKQIVTREGRSAAVPLTDASHYEVELEVVEAEYH
jgi:hypothetical protein